MGGYGMQDRRKGLSREERRGLFACASKGVTPIAPPKRAWEGEETFFVSYGKALRGKEQTPYYQPSLNSGRGVHSHQSTGENLH